MTPTSATGYWDRDGRPITLERWGELFADLEYRTIARTPVEPGTVITMWLGHDGLEGPGVVPVGPPLIFGTLVWDGREFFDSTVAEAQARHDHWVRWSVCWKNSGVPHHALDDENEWVHERVNAGETLTDIAAEIGVSSQALGRRLRRYRERMSLEGRAPYPGNRFNAKQPGAYRKVNGEG